MQKIYKNFVIKKVKKVLNKSGEKRIITFFLICIYAIYIYMYIYSPVRTNRGEGVLIKGGATDNLNINKRGGPNKRGDLKNVP